MTRPQVVTTRFKLSPAQTSFWRATYEIQTTGTPFRVYLRPEGV